MTRPLRWFAQQSDQENTAACLATNLDLHARPRSVAEIQSLLSGAGDPAAAGSLLEVARLLGMRPRHVRLTRVADLGYLPRGSLLQHKPGHRVVFDRLRSDRVMVVDPRCGPRSLERVELEREVPGDAFELEPLTSERNCGSTTLTSVRRLLRRQYGAVLGVIAVSVLLQLLALSVPFVLGLLGDVIVPRDDHELLRLLAAGLVVLLLFEFIAHLAREYAIVFLRARLSRHLTLEFVEHLLQLPYSFFASHSRGDLMMRGRANSALHDLASNGAAAVFLDGPVTVLFFLLLLIGSLPVALLTMGIGTLEVTIAVLGRRRLRRSTHDLLAARARSQSFLVNMLTGMEEIKATGTAPLALERWSRLYQEELARRQSQRRAEAWSSGMSAALVVGGRLLILLGGTYLVISAGLSLGGMLAVNALASGVLTPLSQLVNRLIDLQVLAADIERVDEVRLARPEQQRSGAAPAPRLRGGIRFERVSFRYAPGGPLVLRELSCEIRPGELVAVVGQSGAGKSTLASLLVGLYPPTEGKVLFDGVDLRRLDLLSTRRQVGFVPQRPFILGGASLGENIGLGHAEIDLRQIEDAAKKAELHHEIEALPMKYATALSETGSGIPGGQRQRLTLARALAHRPSVLVLDEATSSLDGPTEWAVQQNLQSLRCTRVVIAHRLSTVAAADRILVLSSGTIVEEGTHQELLERGGMYRDLVSSQLH